MSKDFDIEKLLRSGALGPSFLGASQSSLDRILPLGVSVDAIAANSKKLIGNLRLIEEALYRPNGYLEPLAPEQKGNPRSDQMAFVLVTDFVLGSYLTMGFPELIIEGMLGRKLVDQDFATDLFGELFEVDPDVSPTAAVDYYNSKSDKDIPVLVHLRDSIYQRLMDDFRLYNSRHEVIDLEVLDDLLAHSARRSEQTQVSFYREELARCQSVSDFKRSLSGVVAKAAVVPVAPSPASAPDLSKVYKDQAAALQRQVDELSERVGLLTRSKSDEDQEINQLREINRSMRARLRALESRESAQRDQGTAEETIIPTQWDQLEEFCDRQLAGRVVLSKRAIRAARTSVFRNIGFAYEVLLMLARDYAPMRAGEVGARERFEARCRDLRVTVGLIGEAVDHHKTRQAYRVQHLGKSIAMDLHVQGSSSRDPREGFRLYFTYMEEGELDGYVLVGSFPSHLDNTLS